MSFPTPTAAAELAERGYVRCHDGRDHHISALSDETLIGLRKVMRTFASRLQASAREYGIVHAALDAECVRRGIATRASSYGAQRCSAAGCESVPLFRVGSSAYCKRHRRVAQMRRLNATREINRQQDRASRELYARKARADTVTLGRLDLHAARKRYK